jgi:hypothetical protein
MTELTPAEWQQLRELWDRGMASMQEHTSMPQVGEWLAALRLHASEAIDMGLRRATADAELDAGLRKALESIPQEQLLELQSVLADG